MLLRPVMLYARGQIFLDICVERGIKKFQEEVMVLSFI
jgi:hypothetical protein